MHHRILQCLKFRKTIFFITIAILVFCIFGLRFLTFDFKLDVMKKDRFTEQTIFITVYDKHLFDNQHLALLAKMQDDFSKIKLLKKITSLYTMPNVRRYLDEKEWHAVLENQPYSNDSLALIKSDILNNELFVGRFVNKRTDTMLFYLNFGKDKYGKLDLEARNAVQKVLDQYQSDFTRLFQSGSPELVYALSKKTIHDLLVSLPMVVIFICILFGWLFRSALMSFIPLGIAVYGIVCAVGAMSWFGIPVSELFLLAIGLALAITVASNTHMIYAYQESQRRFPAASSRDHLTFMLKKVLLPLLLSAFAALLGFLIDLLSSIRILQDLTYAFTFCLVFSTLVTVFVVPLLLPLMSMPKPKERRYFKAIIDFFLKLNDIFVTHTYKMIIVLLIMICAGFYFAKHLTIETIPYGLFKKNDSFMQNIYFSGRQVSPQNILQINIFSKQKNIFLESKYLQKILDEEKKLLQISNTSYTYSIADVIATTNKIFLYNSQNVFKIPVNTTLLKNYYRELSKQEFMKTLINKDFNALSVFVNYNIYSSEALGRYKEKIESSLKSAFKDTPLHFEIKDYWAEYAEIMNNLLMLQILSIGSIYLICFLVVGVMLRSIKAGIISVIPNIVPLCVIAITQYFSGIPISLISIILYSIVVGLSIDETAHIFYSFKREWIKSQNKSLAVREALRSQVTPVTIASATIALTCIALLSSQFLPVTQLSFLIFIGVLSTWVSGLVVTPFLMQKVDIT